MKGLVLALVVAILTLVIGVFGNLVVAKFNDRTFSWRFLTGAVVLGSVITVALLAKIESDKLSGSTDESDSLPPATVTSGALPPPTATPDESPTPSPTVDDPHPLLFTDRTFKITDEGCYGTNGLDMDEPRATGTYTIEFEYSSCPPASHIPPINIQNGAQAIAMTDSETPTYEECDLAISSEPIESFFPEVGQTLCVLSSSDTRYWSTSTGPVMGYAHVEKLADGADGTLYRGRISLKATGWLVNP